MARVKHEFLEIQHGHRKIKVQYPSCPICEAADELLATEKSRCVQCLKNGRSKFKLDKKHRDARAGEHEVETEEYEENEHATL